MSAEHIVFLPGMLCDARLFDGQTTDLTIPYHVASLVGADSIVELATNVLKDAPPRFAVAGLSMGGIVALEMWRQAPERISHLMLIDTTPYADTLQKRANRLEQVAKAAAGGLRELAAESLKPMYLGTQRREDPVLLAEILDMAMQLGPDVFESQSTALRTRPDSSGTLATINIPTAVVCGAEDRLCTPEVHAFMAATIPDATLTEIPDCGHMSTMEFPDVVRTALQDLVAR